MDQAQNHWKRKTLLFLISQCITLFGSMIVQMSIIWYVTLKTSSGGWVAAFTICSYLPQFLISFFAGVWADRYNRKKLIILSDAVIMIATLVMFFVMPVISSDSILLSALLAVSIIRAIGAGIQTPAVNAVIPQVVPEEYLMKYNGLNATVQSIVQFAAPAAVRRFNVSRAPRFIAGDLGSTGKLHLFRTDPAVLTIIPTSIRPRNYCSFIICAGAILTLASLSFG